MREEKIQFLDKLILRSPFFSLSNINYSESDLKSLFSDKFFQEAVYLASPSLHSKLVLFLSDRLSESESLKLTVSLTKYHIRMRTRCTPFGLFSGCTLIDWGKETNISYENKIARFTGLDLNVVIQLILELNRSYNVMRIASYYPNSTLLKSHSNKYRYTEYFYKNDQRQHRLCSIESNSYLEQILYLAGSGASLEELFKYLVNNGINFRVALKYLKELIESQVLVSSLEPTLFGDEPFSFYLKSLESGSSRKGVVRLVEHLKQVESTLKLIDANKEFNIKSYQEVIESISNLVGVKPRSFFQVLSEPILHNNSSISESLQSDLIDVIDCLRKIRPRHGEHKLDHFKQRFIKRYDSREVPLLKALDTESGIGYPLRSKSGSFPTKIIKDLKFPSLQPDVNVEEQWNERMSFLLHHLTESIKSNDDQINFSIEDFKDFDADKQELPDTMSVLFSIGNGGQLNFKFTCSASANTILGRFTVGNERLLKFAVGISKVEDEIYDSSVVVAEILHLPEDGAANILTRGKLREYEIPFLCASQSDREHQIPINDILISVVENRIVLRSKSLNKEIRPILSNAHAYSLNSLPIYQLLFDLQYQGKLPFINFDWGLLKMEFEKFPRVTIGDIIVSPAQWTIKRYRFAELLKLDKTITIEAFSNWKNEFGIPDIFILILGDNFLVINSEDLISVRIFMDEIKNQDFIFIEEFLFNCSSDSRTNEIVASVKTPTNKIDSHHFLFNSESEEKREYKVGSRWLYFKIYCGEKTADNIIMEAIGPLVNFLKKSGVIESWFYIRYADPENHIRLRFKLWDSQSIGIVVDELNKNLRTFFEVEEIIDLKIEDYKREIERYDPNGMDLAEKLFQIDSDYVLRILSLGKLRSSLSSRELASFKIIDSLLDSFKLDIDTKLKFTEYVLRGYAKEFNPKNSKKLRKEINSKYAEFRSEIYEILRDSGHFIGITEIIKQKANEDQILADLILRKIDSGLIHLHLFDLLSSYIHMSINRLFISDQRANEYVIYEFLNRYYNGIVARSSVEQVYKH